jgi:hypothetical protein
VLARRNEAAGMAFLTKGDNMLLADPVVPLRQVMGRVSVIKRRGRQMSLDTAAWRRLSFLIAVIMLIWSQLSKQVQKLTRRPGSSGPNSLTARFSKMVHAGFQLLLKTSQRLFSRWHT